MGARVLIIEREAAADLALYTEALGRVAPTLSVATATDEDEALDNAQDAEILISKAHSIPQHLVYSMPKLKWIQALTTGVDPIDAMDLAPEVIVTSMRGIHGPQMSELAFLLMLSLQRGFPRMLDHQKQHLWKRWPQPLLNGKLAVLVGVGQISEDLAKRCQAFGMGVAGISDGRQQAPGFDRIYPRSQLAEAAALADFLIVLVPSTPATYHMIDATILAAMRPNAFLINIARGPVVDEAALANSLRLRQIAGAALDVFATEPLPTDNPLWDLDNIILTPHIGGMSDNYAEQALAVISHNVRAFLSGKPETMRNIVKRPA